MREMSCGFAWTVDCVPKLRTCRSHTDAALIALKAR